MWQTRIIRAAGVCESRHDDRAIAANHVRLGGMSDADAKIYRTPYAEAYRKGYLAGRRGCTSIDKPYEND
jgi:hypothetical protein